MTTAWSAIIFSSHFGMSNQGGLMYGLFSTNKFALKASLPAAFTVVFHGVVTRELVVEVRSEQVYPWFEFQEASGSLKDVGVQQHVVLVPLPVVRLGHRSFFILGHPAFDFVNDN